MKKIYTTLLAVSALYVGQAQVRNNSTPTNNSISGTTAFLDASSYVPWNNSTNVGKGLVFPRTNLVNLTTLKAPVQGLPASFPNRLDGMIVYNTESGTAAIGGTPVKRGFYYYKNDSNSLQGGTWVPLGRTDSGSEWTYNPSNERIELNRSGQGDFRNKISYTSKGVLFNVDLGGYSIREKDGSVIPAPDSFAAKSNLVSDDKNIPLYDYKGTKTKTLTYSGVYANNNDESIDNLHNYTTSLTISTDNTSSYRGIYGMTSTVSHYGTGTTSLIRGILSRIDINGNSSNNAYVDGSIGMIRFYNGNGTFDKVSGATGSIFLENGAEQNISELNGVSAVLRTFEGSNANITDYNMFHGTPTFGSNSSLTIENFKGFSLDNMDRFVNNPTISVTNSYGLYLDDIENGNTSNYAIYTKKGDVRFGDLADNTASEDRVVITNNDGVLKTENISNLVQNNGLWEDVSGAARPYVHLRKYGMISLTGEYTGVGIKTYNNAATYAGGIGVIRARGTESAPMPPLDGDNLTTLGAGGYDGEKDVYNSASIFAFAHGDWSTTNHSADLSFYTTDGLSREMRMKLSPEGNLSIGTDRVSERLNVATNRNSQFTRVASFYAPSLDQGKSAHISVGKKNGINNNGSIDFLWNAEGSPLNGIALNLHGYSDSGKPYILFAQGTGNVGVGTNSPEERLDVRGNLQVKNSSSSSRVFIDAPLNNFAYTSYAEGGVRRWDIGKNKKAETGSNVGSDFYISSFADNGDPLRTDVIIKRDNGNVGIGTNAPTEKLEVAGNVKADRFIATATGSVFPDYVFEKYYNGESKLNANYDFKTLDQVESFVKANGHLPGYISAKEIKEAGQLDMTATQITNVEKIEELYLHLIEKEKEVQSLKTELNAQKKDMQELKSLVQQLLNK